MNRRNLVNERQPFGEVKSEGMHGGGGRPGEHHCVPGDTSVRLNCGVDHPDSKENQAPGARATALKHGHEPFYWTGIPDKGVV